MLILSTDRRTNGPTDRRTNGPTGKKVLPPLTQGLPALVDGAFQYGLSDINLPKIPTQPIGYDDALQILKIMGGKPVPNALHIGDWKGGLNITYRFGPGFNSANVHKKLRLVVNNVMKTKIIYNVIGILDGSVEEDRYVILGNHRDAWGLGAMDAASGTTALLEVARLFGRIHSDTDWRPRRTVVFASWTGEEMGLIGSTEWVEEHIHLLSQKAVAYINVDTCIKGPFLSPDASPTLMAILREVTQYISFRNTTLLNEWIKHQDQISGVVKILGSGSDQAAFAFFAGIPAINIMFKFDKKKYPISGYPAYHTGYETLYLVNKFIDPDFSLHKTCTQLLGVLLHAISGSILLPYRIDELANRVLIDYKYIYKMNANHEKFGAKYDIYGDNKPLIDMLEKSLAAFVSAANDWTEMIRHLDINNPLLVRRANDAMMGVERAFIRPEGLHERPEIKNLLYAPFKYNKYSTVVFPGMLDLMRQISITQRGDVSKVPQLRQSLRRHISDIAIALRSATNLLNTHPL
ncbi:unnamed protein product [Medioppia subpectinata]|uniref:Uncharacterized protein n=1 Tax=Medioppia subpectinata TaxID=1979941 RepID=A0A7R9Q6Y3_9ACAR|nr:unnamed protein product [Medioppia subpectinata]CAG2115287.1 unnamed protein product [Medioppia subpectinata]